MAREHSADDGAYALLVAEPGKQMRSLHTLRHRRLRRALERYIVAPWGGAPTKYKNRSVTSSLGVQHLERCTASEITSKVLVEDWPNAAIALGSALSACRGDDLGSALSWCREEIAKKARTDLRSKNTRHATRA